MNSSDKKLEVAVEESIGAFPTKAYVIYCSTGCTCCCNENFYEGLYKYRETAQKRIDFFKDPEAHNNPLASQYARKGNYSITEVSVEKISGDRILINDERVFHGTFVENEGVPTHLGEDL